MFVASIIFILIVPWLDSWVNLLCNVWNNQMPKQKPRHLGDLHIVHVEAYANTRHAYVITLNLNLNLHFRVKGLMGLREYFTQKRKFRHYLFIVMSMEGWVKFFYPPNGWSPYPKTRSSSISGSCSLVGGLQSGRLARELVQQELFCARFTTQLWPEPEGKVLDLPVNLSQSLFLPSPMVMNCG